MKIIINRGDTKKKDSVVTVCFQSFLRYEEKS